MTEQNVKTTPADHEKRAHLIRTPEGSAISVTFDHLDTCTDLDVLISTLAKSDNFDEQLEAMFNLRYVVISSYLLSVNSINDSQLLFAIVLVKIPLTMRQVQTGNAEPRESAVKFMKQNDLDKRVPWRIVEGGVIPNVMKLLLQSKHPLAKVKAADLLTNLCNLPRLMAKIFRDPASSPFLPEIVRMLSLPAVRDLSFKAPAISVICRLCMSNHLHAALHENDLVSKILKGFADPSVFKQPESLTLEQQKFDSIAPQAIMLLARSNDPIHLSRLLPAVPWFRDSFVAHPVPPRSGCACDAAENERKREQQKPARQPWGQHALMFSNALVYLIRSAAFFRFN